MSTSSEGSNANYVFIMIFLIFALGYLLLLLMSIYRAKTAFSRKKTIVVSKIFYVLGILLCGFRVSSSLLLIIDSYDNNVSDPNDQGGLTKLVYNAFFISDSIFCLQFFSLFWYLMIYYYKAHVRVGNVIGKVVNPVGSSKGLNIYSLIFASYALLNIVFVTLYNLGQDGATVKSELYILGSSFNNSLSILYYLIVLVSLKFRFSGAPAKSILLAKELHLLEKMSYVWVFGRVFETALEIVIAVNQQTISDLIVGQQQDQGIFWSVLSYFILPANYVIAEVIPLLYSLQQESVDVLCKSTSEHDNANSNAYLNLLPSQVADENWSRASSEIPQGTISQLFLKREEISNEGNELNQSQEGDNQAVINIQFSNNEQFVILDKKERKKGLGYIQKIQLNKIDKSNNSKKQYQILAFRTLPMDSLSSWILNEINFDIKKLKQIKLRHLCNINAVAMDKNQCFLVSKFCTQGSLQDIIINNNINSKNQKSDLQSINKPLTPHFNVKITKKDNFTPVVFKFSTETKMRTAINIAHTMYKLHKIGIFHGHLSSSNILFDEQLRVKISDVLLTGLKKLMSFKFGYSNKSHFTAPEHLGESDNLVRNPTIKSDVYSFAFILFELFSERQAFEKLTLEDLKKTIITENSRPKISEEGLIPKEVATIIRLCWLPNPSERPDFSVILTNLRKINNEDSDIEKQKNDIDQKESRKKPKRKSSECLLYSSDEEDD